MSRRDRDRFCHVDRTPSAFLSGRESGPLAPRATSTFVWVPQRLDGAPGIVACGRQGRRWTDTYSVPSCESCHVLLHRPPRAVRHRQALRDEAPGFSGAAPSPAPSPAGRTMSTRRAGRPPGRRHVATRRHPVASARGGWGPCPGLPNPARARAYRPGSPADMSGRPCRSPCSQRGQGARTRATSPVRAGGIHGPSRPVLPMPPDRSCVWVAPGRERHGRCSPGRWGSVPLIGTSGANREGPGVATTPVGPAAGEKLPCDVHGGGRRGGVGVGRPSAPASGGRRAAPRRRRR
jgi:hypothetical protein